MLTKMIHPMCLTPEWRAALEYETFRVSRDDYRQFDDMVRNWNEEE